MCNNRLSVLGFVLTIICPMMVLADEIDTATAVEIIRSKEELISSVRYRCLEEWTSGNQSSGRAQVAIDSNGRFRFDTASNLPSLDGKMINSEEILTFDRNIYRSQKQQTTGAEISKEDASPAGLIREDDDVDWFREGYGPQSLRYFYPYFFPLNEAAKSHHLSSFLQSKIDGGNNVHVNENSDGIWEITTVLSTIPIEEPNDDITLFSHIVFDPAKGRAGAVSRVFVSQLENFVEASNTPEAIMEDISYGLQEVNGFWVPQTVAFYNQSVKDDGTPIVSYEYSDVQLNVPLARGDFEIDWKKGTDMIDEVAQQLYIVSGTPVDEQEAVKNFAVAYGIEKSEHKKLAPNYSHSIVLWVNVAILVLVVGWIGFRSFKRRNASLLLIIAHVFILQGGGLAHKVHAGEQELHSELQQNPLFQFDDGWWRTTGRGNEFRVTQCGFYVTCYTLTFFDVPYDATLVQENLPPSPKGVSIDKLQRVLKAHGLKVDGRKNVGVKDLRDLSFGTLAIIALPVAENGDHYFVFGNNQGETYIADVPRRLTYLKDLSDTEMRDLASLLAERNGVALIVQPTLRNVDMSTAFSISPSRIDLGAFSVKSNATTQKSIRRNLALQNMSNSPIAVSVATSCSCVGRLNWRHRIIDPGQTEQLAISLLPEDWPLGNRETTLTITFPDGSSENIVIFGTGHDGRGGKHLSVISPLEVQYSLPQGNTGDFRHSFEQKLLVSRDIEGQLDARSSVEWLQVALLPSSQTRDPKTSSMVQRSLECTIRGSKDLVQEVRKHGDSVTGIVTITAANETLSASFQVKLTSEPRFQIDPRQLIIGGNGVGSIRLCGLDEFADRIKEVSVSVAPPGLLVTTKKKTDDSVIVAFETTDQTYNKHYLATCMVEFIDGSYDTATLVVHVSQ